MKKSPVFSIKQSHSVYTATVADESDNWDREYEFTVFNDGSVTINDYEFPCPADAVKVMQQIAEFLETSKFGKK